MLVFAASVVGAAGFFVASLLLARVLGPAGRGTVAFITVTALLTARLAKVGLSPATTVLAARRIGDRAVMLSNLVVFSLGASLVGVGVVVGGLYALDARPAGLEDGHLPILAVAILAAALVDDSFLIGSGRLREAAVISAGGGWLYAGAVTAVVATVGLGVESAVVAWTAAHLVWGAVLAVVGVRVAGAALPSVALLVESVRFGVRAWAGSVSQFLNARLDQILLGALASNVSLGLYAVAVNAAEILLFLPNAIATSLLPRQAREGSAALQQTLRTFRSATVLTIGSGAAAAVVGSLLIPPVFGSDFRGSVVPFLLLLPGALGYAALAVFTNALLASEAPGLASVSRTVALAAGLGLDLALIPVFGASGAAAAASAAFLAGGATATVLYRRRIAFSWTEVVPSGEDVGFLFAVAARGLPRARGAR